MTALRALHATRNAAGLSEDDARDLYARVTEGKRSTRAMSETELKLCRSEIVRLFPDAGKRRSKGSRKRLEGPYAKKFQALWIAAWNLGLTRERSDAALIAFVKRQTGIDHANWLRDQADMAKVVEGLKAWMARDGGVDWNNGNHKPDWMRRDGAKIAVAQAAKLGVSLAIQTTLIAGRSPEKLTDSDWITVMNRLGERVRKAQA